MSQRFTYLITSLLLASHAAHAEEKSAVHIPPIREVIEQNQTPMSYERSDPVWQGYSNTVQNKIIRVPGVLPADAAGRKIYGKVGLNLIIGIDGGLLDVYPIEAKNSDDDNILAETAIAQAKAAAPFAAPPKEIIKDQKSIQLHIFLSYAKGERMPPLYGPTERFRIQMRGGFN